MKIDKEVRKKISGDYSWPEFEIYVSDYGNAHIVIDGRFIRVGNRNAVAKLFLEFDKLFKQYDCNLKKEQAFRDIKVDCD